MSVTKPLRETILCLIVEALPAVRDVVGVSAAVTGELVQTVVLAAGVGLGVRGRSVLRVIVLQALHFMLGFHSPWDYVNMRPT